jgi:hypothetical protein
MAMKCYVLFILGTAELHLGITQSQGARRARANCYIPFFYGRPEEGRVSLAIHSRWKKRLISVTKHDQILVKMCYHTLYAYISWADISWPYTLWVWAYISRRTSHGHTLYGCDYTLNTRTPYRHTHYGRVPHRPVYQISNRFWARFPIPHPTLTITFHRRIFPHISASYS